MAYARRCCGRKGYGRGCRNELAKLTDWPLMLHGRVLLGSNSAMNDICDVVHGTEELLRATFNVFNRPDRARVEGLNLPIFCFKPDAVATVPGANGQITSLSVVMRLNLKILAVDLDGSLFRIAHLNACGSSYF